MTRNERIILLFVALLATWFALSGRFTVMFVAMGVASSALVALLTHRLIEPALGPPRGGPAALPRRVFATGLYLIWLLSRLPGATLYIAYYALHPRRTVEPRVMRFRTNYSSPTERTLLANSITLVPGTLTIEEHENNFVVHVLYPGAADDLISAKLQNRVSDGFLEPREEPPQITWEPVDDKDDT